MKSGANEKPAFERLFTRLHEIARIMGKADKAQAVKTIKAEFSEFADIPDNTVKTNITAFPFLASVYQESRTQSADSAQTENELESARQENNQLKQNVKRLNSVIARLYEDVSQINPLYIKDKPSDKPVSVSIEDKPSDKPVSVSIADKPSDKPFYIIDKPSDKPENEEENSMTEGIIERLERLENAVFNQDKPYQVNLSDDKPVRPEKLRIGKWNITKRQNTYRAYRNFGDKGDIRGNKAVYIGRDKDKAEEKIKAAGYPVD